MKALPLYIITLASISTGFGQTVNWNSLKPEIRHIVNVNAGWDYGTTFGLGYGQKLKTAFPLIVGAELSLPAGQDLVDDFKLKSGGQVRIFRYKNLLASVKVYGIFRRYESDFGRFVNFGSEFSSAIGYYRPRWYAAAEFGFDKSIVTHIRHSALIEEYYPEIQHGWYIPGGGNFFYGVQVGYSPAAYDVYLKAGKSITQDFKAHAAIPMYLQFGCNVKF
jgi:hypothetical protein